MKLILLVTEILTSNIQRNKCYLRLKRFFIRVVLPFEYGTLLAGLEAAYLNFATFSLL